MAVWRSKLGGEFPRELVERLDAEHHRVLRDLRKKPENARCAECGGTDTAWASVSLGVFVCVRCADVHRALGTHISKMKGCGGTYLWGPDEIQRMREVGNARARELYCSAGKVPQMSAAASKEELMDFCLKKYQHRLWAGTSAEDATSSKSAQDAPPSKSAQGKDLCVPPLRVIKGSACKASAAPVSCTSAKPTASATQADLIDLDSFFDMLEGSGQVPAEWQQPQSSVGMAGDSSVAQPTGTPEATPPTLDSFLELCLNATAKPAAVSATGPNVDCTSKFAPTPNAGPVRTDLKHVNSESFWADWGEW